MPESFQSINQPSGAGIPQFAQTTPVVGGGGAEALAVAANLGATIFSRMAPERAKREKLEAKVESDTALGAFQQGLLNIRQAAATDSRVNATTESRLLLSKFSTEHPELRLEASKAYKQETGAAPSGLDPVEEAKLKLSNEAISKGFGSFGASEEYNAKQLEIYTNIKRQDAVLSNRIQQVTAQVQEGNLHKSELRRTVLNSFHELSGTYTTKTVSDMDELMSQYNSGALQLQDAQLKIRDARNKINREIASLGEFSTDPTVKAYTQPMLDSIQLTEDVITGKIEREAIDSTIKLNKARAKNVFMADPSIVDLVVASEAFNHTAGAQPRVSNKVLEFLTTSQKAREKIVPVNPQNLDTEEKDAVQTTLKSMLNDKKASVNSKREAAATITGVAEHLNRNGMDFNAEDKKFVIELLNTEGAMDILDARQKSAVMSAFSVYLIDDVDRGVRENILAKDIPVATSLTGARVLGGDPNAKRPVSEVADLRVEDGVIFWELKPEFKGVPRAQQAIRKVNADIDDVVTPAINVNAKGLGIPFKQSAALFIPGLEGGDVDEAKKPTTDLGGPAPEPTGKVDATEFKEVLGQRESGGEYNITNQLGYLGKYQFGGAALQDLGYKEGKDWTGKDGINSKEDFLNSPEAQENAVDKWLPMLESRLKKAGAYDYVGTEIDGVVVTEEGLLAASHLVGASGVVRMLKTGVIPQDANGVKATEYLGLMVGR